MLTKESSLSLVGSFKVVFLAIKIALGMDAKSYATSFGHLVITSMQEPNP